MNVRKFWKKLHSVPGLGRNVVAIALMVMLGLGATAYSFSNQDFVLPGSERTEFAADFASAANVKVDQGPGVRIAGVEVGKIVGSSVTTGGKARIQMSIEGDQKVYENARLVLRTKSVLNEMYVELSPGGPPASELSASSVIPFTQTSTPVKADAILEKLDSRTQAALSDLLAASDSALADAPESMPVAIDSVSTAADAFGPVATSLATRREAIADLVTALARIANATGTNRERTASLAASLESTLQVLARRDDEIKSTLDRLPGTTAALRTATGELDDLADELDPTLENIEEASDELPPALRRFTSTVDELGTVSAKARPVVRAARPLVADLKPTVHDAGLAFRDLRPLSARLEPATATLLPYLKEGSLQAFIYNTSAVFRDSDANGGYIRGHLVAPLPDGGVIPGTHGGKPDPTRGIVPWK